MKIILICAALLTIDWLAIKPNNFQIRDGEIYDKTTPRRKEKDELEIFSRGSIKAVKKLIDQGFDINKRHPKTGETPLIYACVGDRADIVELLIAKGANVNSKNIYKSNALTLAVYRKNVTITKMLLSAGAKVNFHDSRGYTPLMRAVEMESLELVDVLLKAGAKLQLEKFEVTALHIVARFGQIEVGEKLLQLGANLEAQDDSYQATPLMYAVEMKRLEMVKFLVSKGANVNAVDNSGRSVLFKAINEERIEIVEFLLNNHAQVNGSAVLSAASAEPRILKAILDKMGGNTKAIVEMKTKDGRTPLMRAVFHDQAVKSTKNVEMLLAAGADPRVKDIYEQDALSYAREGKYRPLIRLLEKAVKTWKDNNKK